MRFGIPLLILYGIALALIAFWPVHVGREMTGLLRALARAVPLLSSDVVEFGANVLPFVPLGILLALAMPRHRPLVVPVALVVTGAIEAGQALFLDERTASLRDVLANTVGAAAGLLIVLISERNSSGPVAVPDTAPRPDDGEGPERRW
jgi:hypothetical protein